MQHLKQTFLGDAFWLIFAVFLICVWETKAIESDPEYPNNTTPLLSFHLI